MKAKHSIVGKTKDAFTRTDLLVSLAVLAVMALFVRQLAASPRDSGYQARCMDNMRRLMLAELMYATENNDYLTWPNWGNDASMKGWAYSGAIGPNQAPRNGVIPGTVQSGLLWKYVLNEQVYQCPLDFDRTNDDTSPLFSSASYKQLFAIRDFRISSYMMNGAVCGFGSLATGSTYKLSQFRPNAMALWEPDESIPFYFNDGSAFVDEGTTRRHGMGGNIGRFDGGAEFMSYQTYYKYAGSEGSRGATVSTQLPNRLWCNPRTLNGLY